MTVLIIADDGEFSRDLMARWQTERHAPGFTVVSSTVWQGAERGFDMAVLGPLPADRLTSMLRILETSCAAPALCIIDDAALIQSTRREFPRVLVLRHYDGWLDAAVLVGGEVLRRLDANERARQAEEAALGLHRYATLGRYMLEMRHSINNALTSVLGHAELLLLEPGMFSNEIREQIDTIHSMSLRLHEILQRFSSLDTEMQFAERQSQAETRARSQDMRASS
jgi:signal transduction histidine kinase